uniref:Putative antitoxin n=1 Tax=viral metagenome TaxID=1070528 RepID=A0A6M3JKP4_9ZZZZ
MKTLKVKTLINKLIQRLGTEKAVADCLGISERWVIYLAKGQRKASFYLAKAIKDEVENGMS